MIFFCFNEKYNGIFKSQVIDVLKNYNELGFNFKLISIISIRNFFSQRRLIKNYYSHSLVIPMFPFLRFWSLNKFLIRFFITKSDIIISRGIFATNLVLLNNLKVIYDGRGAISAEQNEYGVYNGTGLESIIFKLEKNAVLNSNYRIAVSEKLLEYWKNNYQYIGENHIVIPSCSNFEFDSSYIDKKYLISEEIIIVFSGASSRWHSFDEMAINFENFLNYSDKIKIIFLSKLNSKMTELIDKFPKRVSQKYVESYQVKNILRKADYGYVYRSKSITNFVASPVKIAEYLSCGLKLLISDNLGDYSSLVKNNKLGFNLDDNTFNYSDLKKVSVKEKLRISSFANENLSYKSLKIKNKYLKLINNNRFSN